MYTGHDIVKAFNREEKNPVKYFDASTTISYVNPAWKSQFLSGIDDAGHQCCIGNLAYVAVCLLGGYLAINGKSVHR